MIKTCNVCGGLEHGQRMYMCECGLPKDERNRYREALDRIAFGCYPYEPGEAYAMQRIAREALSKTTVGNEIYVITKDGIKAVQKHIDRKAHTTPRPQLMPDQLESSSVTECKHDNWRNSKTYPPDSKTLTQRRMEWCGVCGKLLDDRTWKIPLPSEIQSPNP